MTSPQSSPNRVKKAAILVWAVIGAGLGWLAAAWYFLRNGADGSLVTALMVMFLVTWYGARSSRWLWLRITCGIWLGGSLVSLFDPSVSEREPDRVVVVLRGFSYGEFSYVPWGLASAVFWMAMLITIASPASNDDRERNQPA